MSEPSMNQNAIHTAYCKCYDKCHKALEESMAYITIQHLRGGGYRLLATHRPGFESCCRLANVRDWAQNVMYRLAYLHYFDSAALDKYFDELDKVGYD